MAIKPLVRARYPAAGMNTKTRERTVQSLGDQLRSYWHWSETRVTAAVIALAVIGHYALGITWLAPYFELQYPITREDGTERFERGSRDAYMIGFWVVVFTLLRATVMRGVLRPIAHSQGMYAPTKVQRFMEQGWLICFYITSWSVGFWLLYHSTYWFNTPAHWPDYPYNHLTTSMKYYYLIQLAFWCQQLVVVNVEERRKDYAVMMSHHVITIALMVGSYWVHVTPIGHSILCCMDFADIFLSSAKVFNYLKWQRTTDSLFVVFIVSWVITRHIFFNMLTYSVAVEFPQQFDLIWTPQGERLFTLTWYYLLVGLLCSLQVLCIYWFWLVIGILRRVVSGNKPEDTRSDSEDGGESDTEAADADADDVEVAAAAVVAGVASTTSALKEATTTTATKKKPGKKLA